MMTTIRNPAAGGASFRRLRSTIGPCSNRRRSGFRSALQTARRLLWEQAEPVGVSATEIVAIEDELDELFSVLRSAEEAGFPVNVSYVT